MPHIEQIAAMETRVAELATGETRLLEAAVAKRRVGEIRIPDRRQARQAPLEPAFRQVEVIQRKRYREQEADKRPAACNRCLQFFPIDRAICRRATHLFAYHMTVTARNEACRTHRLSMSSSVPS